MDKKQNETHQTEKPALHDFGAVQDSTTYEFYDENHNVVKLAQFYQAVLIVAVGVHYNKHKPVDNAELLRNAFSYVLDAIAFSCLEKSSSVSHAFYDNSTVEVKHATAVSGLKFNSGDVIRTADICFEDLAENMKNIWYDNYSQHVYLLYPYLKKLAQNFDVSMLWMTDQLLNGAIQAIIGDEYTGFTRDISVRSVTGDDEAEYHFLAPYGATVKHVDQGVQVVNIDEVSYLECMGLKVNDVITHVNGESLSDFRLEGVKLLHLMSLDDRGIAELLLDRDGTEVKVTIHPEHRPRRVVDGRFIKDNLAVVKIREFSRDVNESFYNEVTRLKAEAKLQGYDNIRLALDLRGNTGGFIDSALEVLDSLATPFVSEGEPLVAVQARGSREVFFSGGLVDRFIELDDLYVLQDQNTASVSELVSGVLQDAGVLVIGVPSYGKATLQVARLITKAGRLTTIFNEAESAGVLRVTEGVMYSSSTGLSHQCDGVVPNIMVHYRDFRTGLASMPEVDREVNAEFVSEGERRGEIHASGCHAVISDEYDVEITENANTSVPTYLHEKYNHASYGELKVVTVLDAHVATLLSIADGETQFVDIVDQDPKFRGYGEDFSHYSPIS